MIKKCKNCDTEYEMHTGSNVCPECGERTFLPSEETDSKNVKCFRMTCPAIK